MITYTNTKTTLPGWINTVHQGNPVGYAYETQSHFVHLYGRNIGWWVISPGLTVTEKQNGSIEEWVERVFGAIDIEPTNMSPGESVEGVWRPGMLFQEETKQGLNVTTHQEHSSKRALQLLIERLDELFFYVEPDAHGLQIYSHKTRELLLLASMEVENYWQRYMRSAGVRPTGRYFNTNDYIRLLDPLHLQDYAFTFHAFPSLPEISPFSEWSMDAPTASLSWYDAYNKTKHDRDNHFSDATLERCLEAVTAVVAMYCVRYGPYAIFTGGGNAQSFVEQTLSLELRNPNPATFYVPKISPEDNHRDDLICFDCKDIRQPWQVQSFAALWCSAKY
ncbi:MAG: hypothetical protein AAF703_17890 [Cyanobacteria bacterium P01_D01_bin.105]